MLFAVNGETGKCVGDLPIDTRRRVITVCIIAFICLLLTLPLAIAVSHEPTLAVLAWPLMITIGITYVVDRSYISQMQTAVEAEDADESLSGDGLVMTKRWRTEMLIRKKWARQMLERHMEEQE